jgi:hypothetical protein
MSRVAPALLFFSTWIFPVLGFPLLVWAWLAVADGDWRVVTLVLGVPVVFGYLMPGITTNAVRRWHFTSGWRIGGYYVHHGFVYASKMAFVLLLALHDPRAAATWPGAAATILLVGGATAFGGWWHDIHAIRAGKIVLAGSEGDPRSAEAALATFAPPSYFSIGATYAAAIILAWHHLGTGVASFTWAFLGALAALCVVPSVVFLTLDPSARRSLRIRILKEANR